MRTALFIKTFLLISGCPSYLSTQKPVERSEVATSSYRQNKQIQELEEDAQKFLESDNVENFDDLLTQLPTEFPPSWNIITYQTETKVFLEDLKFDEDGKPSFKFSLAIDSSLNLILSSNDIILSSSKVKHITLDSKLQRHSDVTNILAFLNALSDSAPNTKDVVEFCVKKLKSASKEFQDSNNEDLNLKLEFLIEQLQLSVTPTMGRRYSPRLLWSACTWMRTGPAVYRLLLADRTLTLPTMSHLQRLSSSYSLESGLSSSTIAYLSKRIEGLNQSERIVELLIDEVNLKFKKTQWFCVLLYQTMRPLSFNSFNSCTSYSVLARVNCIGQGWAKSGPRAISGPLKPLIWPAKK